jgi:hypothetical protein
MFGLFNKLLKRGGVNASRLKRAQNAVFKSKSILKQDSTKPIFKKWASLRK